MSQRSPSRIWKNYTQHSQYHFLNNQDVFNCVIRISFVMMNISGYACIYTLCIYTYGFLIFKNRNLEFSLEQKSAASSYIQQIKISNHCVPMATGPGLIMIFHLSPSDRLNSENHSYFNELVLVWHLGMNMSPCSVTIWSPHSVTL